MQMKTGMQLKEKQPARMHLAYTNQWCFSLNIELLSCACVHACVRACVRVCVCVCVVCQGHIHVCFGPEVIKNSNALANATRRLIG